MNTLFLKEIRHSIIHLFYPRLCEGCGKPLITEEEVLCISCSLQVPETGYHDIEDNETALRFAGRVPYINATSYAYFTNDGLLQHLVHGLKYGNKKETGYYLGRRFGRSLQKTGWIGEIDMIIPVPLHKAKKAKRGYNQSMLIAEGMGEILHIPVSENILLRVKDTESQTHKTRSERVNNMAGAFTINGKSQLKGKHILLCDDVLTTGATLEACAMALMKEESIKISIATIGIAIS
jgi:ComF family protein